MSKAEVERFIGDLKGSEDLKKGLTESAGADLKSVHEFAKGKGYDFTEQELHEHVETEKANLSEEDLDKVAGGVSAQEVVVSNVPAAVLDPTFVVTSQAQNSLVVQVSG